MEMDIHAVVIIKLNCLMCQIKLKNACSWFFDQYLKNKNNYKANINIKKQVYNKFNKIILSTFLY